MKKLYYLDESEKERILTLHKKHKENLLTEVEDRETWKKTITDKCDKYATTKPLMSTADLKSIAASLKSNIDSGGATGYASGITEKNINTNLTKIKKTVDFCSLLRIYQERYSEDLLSVLNNEFYNDTNWRDNVKLPILDATEDFNSNITTSTEDKTRKVEKKGWDLYDCVIKKGGRELPNGNYRRYSTKLKSNVIYTDGGKFYVETGGSGTWEDYYCEGDIITPKSSQKTDNKQPNTGSGAGGAQSLAGGYIYQNAFTPEKVSAIKIAVGSTDNSGTLTQDDINKLYVKLS